MVCWPAAEKPRNSVDQEEWRETQTQKTKKTHIIRIIVGSVRPKDDNLPSTHGFIPK